MLELESMTGQNILVMWQGIPDEDVLPGLLAGKSRFALYAVFSMTKGKSVKMLARNHSLVW